MTFRSYVLKLTFGGVLKNTEEIFSAGMHLGNPDKEAGAVSLYEGLDETSRAVIRTALTTMFTNANTRVPNDYELQWVKFALLGPDGLYVEEPIEYGNLSASGGSGIDYIPQGALVVTLDSGKFRDPGKYNRFYLPTVSISEGNNGFMTPTMVTNVSTAVATALNAINAICDDVDPGSGIIAASASGSGSDLRVQSMKIGNVIDTQRRRRNALVETYQTTVLD